MRDKIIILMVYIVILILTSCGIFVDKNEIKNPIDMKEEELVTTQLIVPNTYEGIENDIIKEIFGDSSKVEYSYKDNILTIKTTIEEKRDLAYRFTSLVSSNEFKLASTGNLTINTDQERTFFEFDFSEKATEEFIWETYESIIKYTVFSQAFSGVPVDEIEVKVTSTLNGEPLDEFIVNQEYLLGGSQPEFAEENTNSSEKATSDTENEILVSEITEALNKFYGSIENEDFPHSLIELMSEDESRVMNLYTLGNGTSSENIIYSITQDDITEKLDKDNKNDINAFFERFKYMSKEIEFVAVVDYNDLKGKENFDSNIIENFFGTPEDRYT